MLSRVEKDARGLRGKNVRSETKWAAKDKK